MNGRLSRLPVKHKWRPSVGLIVAVVVGTALLLPFAGLFFFRIYENQLIHQTESELIGQSAVLASVMRRDILANVPSDAPLGAAVSPDDAKADETYRPVAPALDLTRSDILGRRPEAQAAADPADPAFVALGARLAPDLVETQRMTLAGFRLLDPRGVVIAGRSETGLSLAHIEEVADALRGTFRSVMRTRISSREPPPLYSWSRGTSVRVFTAMPVVVRGQVAGVIYASRTPSNVFKSLHDEGGKVAAGGLTIMILAGLIGLIFQRTITRPMRELMARTAAIGRGDRSALAPLSHHGTAEFAKLSESFLDLAEALQTRSDFVATFAAHVTHELKSPLTAIQGAAELMRDDLDTTPRAMSDNEKRRFLDNVIGDTRRLTAIVQRLRELARAENVPTAGVGTMQAAVESLRVSAPPLCIQTQGDLTRAMRISPESIGIVFAHLADNAVQSGATKLTISAQYVDQVAHISISDNGAGVAAPNRDHIFDSFFTTRRESGGTGMGLAIVRAIMRAHGGDIRLDEPDNATGLGAVFIVTAPLADPA